MNTLGKERIAESLAAAALVALLSAAVALGAKVLDNAESLRIAGSLANLASGTLVPAGTPVSAGPAPVRASYPVRRIYDLSGKDGRRVGTGLSVVVEGSGWSAETLVILDDRGRVSTAVVREGSAGVRAEELAGYLRRRWRDGGAELTESADPRDLESAVDAALEAAVRQDRSGREEAR